MMNLPEPERVLLAFDNPTNGRASNRQPKGPFCSLHLQRVCGNCEHFDGHLRQADPGRCACFADEVHPRDPAGECDPWTRKTERLQK
jgi:hypothetical protein